MTNVSSRTRSAPKSATALGPSLRWRLGASAWMLLLVIGGGALSWSAFGIVAVVARRRSWGVVAGVYAVAAVAVALPEDPAGQIAQGSLYLVALVHGLIINQGWLLLLWGRKENGLTIFGNARRGKARRNAPSRSTQRAAALPQEAERLVGGSGGSLRSDYVDDSAPAAAASPSRRRTTRAQRRTENEAAANAGAVNGATPLTQAELVDVNTANQRTLARLTGMDRALAKAAIAERTKRGGFASLAAFAAMAGLQPHELMRLGSEAFCSPRPRARRSFGRRVDF
ncbi:hypothetical protein E3T39_12995 [Cryobacterium suzukii]|uniref:Helix-hairpin-helix domain-containing protein n=1 Tax=Cryobacterium suzukii TaxID=1259198 RepID=A0A4R9AD68_9MICO|nr:helix-hairpin-helix domain-containing protein [Cryobacterium suzukii]TFD57696.1 hypothetical protein E3T39_12995 [Cryobacterium suzukii]